MTMYDFTGSRMTPDHIVFSLIRKPAPSLSGHSPLQSEAMWEDFIACFYEMSGFPSPICSKIWDTLNIFPAAFILKDLRRKNTSCSRPLPPAGHVSVITAPKYPAFLPRSSHQPPGDPVLGRGYG